MAYAVLAKDLDQGDEFLYGPFPTLEAAGEFSRKQLEDFLVDHPTYQENEGNGLDCRQATENGELWWEWTVLTLEQPVT